MGGRKRLDPADINVPEMAHDVPKGYPVEFWEQHRFDFVAHVFGPVMSSPRPRVTSRGTFMPADYRKHCDKLSASLAYCRGLYEAKHGSWACDSKMTLDLAFWCPKMPGDIDNLSKTVMDAGQLKKSEPPGAQLWTNDRQIVALSAEWIPVEDDFDWQTVVRIRLQKDA